MKRGILVNWNSIKVVGDALHVQAAGGATVYQHGEISQCED